MSDLHLEFLGADAVAYVDRLEVAGDVLVLAGDAVCFAQRFYPHAHATIRRICERWPLVVYVPGNHESYGCTPGQVTGALEGLQARHANLRVLTPASPIATYGGKRFVGSTLWFPNSPSNRMYSDRISDFKMVRGFAPWVYGQNTAARAALGSQIRKGDIVVTHHLPFPESVNAKYDGSPLNRFFLSDCSDLINPEEQPAVWIHGHTHDACDYMRGETRVICNPLGYPGEPDAGPFNPRCTVEV